MKRTRGTLLRVAWMWFVLTTPLRGAVAIPDDIFELPLESLMDMKVTSVSKHEETLHSASAAVFVLTAEDIRRSGANSIPELLRLVPGLNVARLNAREWAVSARGFNNLYANKLLVLIDGRTIYSPFFSGVEWSAEDLPPENIERIEVIRGPGATVWGANAVNGVINILTKSSKQTKGTLVSGGGGKDELAFGTLRQGGEISETTDYQLYARGYARDNSQLKESSKESFDQSHRGAGGFRIDSDPDSQNSFLLEGDASYLEQEVNRVLAALDPPRNAARNSNGYVDSQNMLGRWTHRSSDVSTSTVQGYYSRRTSSDLSSEVRNSIFDIDLQNEYRGFENQEIVFGAGYRHQFDHFSLGESQILFADPDRRTYPVANTFVQDAISLTPTVTWTLGTKLEHGEYSGSTVQPSTRLNWSVSKHHSVWGSVSRAIRDPARTDTEIKFIGPVIEVPGGDPIVVIYNGTPVLDPEVLYAYESGYRFQPHDKLSFDLAGYVNRYKHLIGLDQQDITLDSTGSYAVLPGNVANVGPATGFGAEFLVDWVATDALRLQAWYAFQRLDVDEPDGGEAINALERQTPRHSASVRALTELGGGFQFDSVFRYVDSLPSVGIDSYVEANFRLGYALSPSTDLSFIVQNALHDQHAEYTNATISSEPADVDRAFFGKITWRLE